MPDTRFLDPRELIIDRYLPEWELYLPRPATVRILVVLELGISPGPPSTGFGLGRVVSYLRNETFGFVNFDVKFALRGTNSSPNAVVVNDAAGEWDFRYTNFRFHSEHDGSHIIDTYDEIWCFGIEPLIHNNGENSSVEDSEYSPTDAEVAVLTSWMDAGGGILAMGDHNFLGSAMCWKIPRVGTMRAWLKDSLDERSVPNRIGTDRHDTNRPQNDSQDPAVTTPPAMIPNTAEEDTITQPLHWKRYSVWSPFRWEVRKRPHPVLCGGSIGIIDRFPDHPHEGLVIHESLIDMTAKCRHDSTKDEYPTVGGVQPKPEVIAWVQTLADPPYNHEKGDQPGRRFPAIGVYNGHTINHGRALVDSTWHHWFDLNIAELETADTEDFRKIKRYFQNVAIWLAPKTDQQKMLAYALFWTVFTPAAIEELDANATIWEIGGSAISILGQKTSDCLVSSWIFEHLPWEIIEAIELYPVPPRPFPPGPFPCWSCPPEDIFISAVMGAMIKQLLPYREQLVESVWGHKNPGKLPYNPDELAKLLHNGVKEGLMSAFEAINANREMLDHAINTMKSSIDFHEQQIRD